MKSSLAVVAVSSGLIMSACGGGKRTDVPGSSRSVYKSSLELTDFDGDLEPLVPADFVVESATAEDWFARLGSEPSARDQRPAKVDALVAEITKRLLGEERFYTNRTPKLSEQLWETFYDKDGWAAGDQCGAMLRSMTESQTLPRYLGPTDEPKSSDQSFGEITLVESCRYLDSSELRRHQLGTLCLTEHRDPDSREFGDKASLVEIKRLGLVSDQMVAEEYWNRTTMFMDNYGKVRDRGAIANRSLWNIETKRVQSAFDQIEHGNSVWPQTGESISKTTERNRMTIEAGEQLRISHDRFRFYDETVDGRDKLFEIKLDLLEISPTEFSLKVSRRKTGEESFKEFNYVLSRALSRDQNCKVQ